MFDIQIAVAKTNKYATGESGDTVEVVERPHGGFSVVLADGQGSGRAAKILSNLVTTKAVSLIKDGVRDGAVARSVHDYLYAYRGGKVSATLTILSVDLATRTLVLSRNSHCPVLISRPGRLAISETEGVSNAIGIYPMTKPLVTELPLEPHIYAVTYSDGLMEAGKRSGSPIDLLGQVAERIDHEERISARTLADDLLETALALDQGRPADDMTVLVLAILPAPEEQVGRISPQVRTMDLHIPL
ncbi:MAG TPA: PP2C family protein-serine/threonine phosphatase [Chloroflexia bacterium]|nr:PP2C family protein-serine/threonine phosphatase [Chloroflexia bacterium]